MSFAESTDMAWRIDGSTTLRLPGVFAMSILAHLALLGLLLQFFSLDSQKAAPSPATLSVGFGHPSGLGQVPMSPGSETASAKDGQAALVHPAAELQSVHPEERAASEPSLGGNATVAAAPLVLRGNFYPAEQVDQRAYALLGPDTSHLVVPATYSGAPIRLRLFVDEGGQVVEAKVRSAAESDVGLALDIADLWKSVAFTPARRAQVDVASYMDVEFQLVGPSGRTGVK